MDSNGPTSLTLDYFQTDPIGSGSYGHIYNFEAGEMKIAVSFGVDYLVGFSVCIAMIT